MILVRTVEITSISCYQRRWFYFKTVCLNQGSFYTQACDIILLYLIGYQVCKCVDGNKKIGPGLHCWLKWGLSLKDVPDAALLAYRVSCLYPCYLIWPPGGSLKWLVEANISKSVYCRVVSKVGWTSKLWFKKPWCKKHRKGDTKEKLMPK